MKSQFHPRSRKPSLLLAILFFFLLAVPALSFGQLKLDWAKGIGSSSQELLPQVVLDDQDNAYLMGSFIDTLDLDPGPGIFNVVTGNLSDIFLVKLDSNGNFIWGRKFGGSGSDRGWDLAIGPFGGIYVAGISSASFSVDGLYVPASFQDAILIKFSSNGNALWARSYQCQGIGWAKSVTTDRLGNVYLAGSFQDSMAFLPGIPTYTGYAIDYMDAYVLSLDSGGGMRWVQTFGGQDLEQVLTVEVDSKQNIYLGGRFSMTAMFDPDTNSIPLVSLGQNSSPNGFVCKLDSNGQYQWARQFGGNWYVEVNRFAIDSLENVYASGRFWDTAYFDPGFSALQLISPNSFDAFLCKMDSAGNTLKLGHLSSLNNIIISDLLLVGPDELYLTGDFAGTADLNLGPATSMHSSSGASDIFISKYDTSLAMVYTVTTGGPISEHGISIQRSPLGGIYLAGLMAGLADLAPGASTYNLQAAGSYDIFFAKYQECDTTMKTIQIAACDSTQVNGESYFNSGSYHQYFTNAKGCDSILTINFTSLSSDSTLLVSGCDSLAVNGQIYHSTGVYQQILTNGAGCDSLLTIDARLLNSSSTLNLSVCDSLDINGQVFLASGTYVQQLTNVNGCDSTLMINLTVNQASDSVLSLSVCDSISLNGLAYSSSGSYTQLLTNSLGCDSMLLLDLTVNQSTNNTSFFSACDSISLNGQTFLSSGTYMQILTNSLGCDSVLSLDLTVNQSTNGSMSFSACDSLSLNGQTYFSSGTYTQFLANSEGCDSTLNLNLYVEPSPLAMIGQSGTTLIANPAGMAYQWLECENGLAPVTGETNSQFIPLISGSYAVVVFDSLCSDTSDCFQVVTTSMVPHISNLAILVVPNPSSGEFKILFPITLGWVNYRITDITGRVVHQGSGQSRNELIFRLDLPNGIYALELVHNLGTSLSRLVLQ